MDTPAETAPIVTSATDRKPDWFFSSMMGHIPPTLNEMHAQGIYANGFSLEEPEAYWGKKDVQGAFTDKDGSVRRDLFDASYKAASARYKNHRITELNLVNFTDMGPSVTAMKAGVKNSPAVIYDAPVDQSGRSFQSGYTFTDPFSSQEKSLKEIATETGVKDASGKYTPAKDFQGTAKFAMDDKGQLKFNENGSPYLTPVKDGEQLHQWDVVYSPFTKAIGGYGYDYSWKNLAASVLKNPINMLARSVDDMVEYARGLGDLVGIDTKGGTLNTIENFAKSFEIPSTEKNQGLIVNVENTVDIAQQALLQLGAMAGIGAAVTALTKNPKAGQIAGRIFMTAISAGYMGEVARDNGLTKNESALLLALATAGIYKLMPLEEAVLGSLRTKESTAALIKSLAEDPNLKMQVVDAVRRPTTSKLRALTSGIGEVAKTFVSTDKFRSAVFRLENAAPVLVGAGGEAVEEFAEQGLDLALRSGYTAYSNAFDDSRHPFKMNFSDEMSQLGQAALGGAIGGSAAHGFFSRMLKNHPEQAQTWHDMVMDGKEQVLRDFAARMHTQGRLDSDWLTPEGKMTKPSTGNSRNDANLKVVNGVTDYMVELRDASGIKDLAKNNIQAAKGLFTQVIAASSVGKDASDLHTKIIAITDELEKAKVAQTPDKELIATKTDELKLNQEALKKITSGEFVADYVTEGLYNTLALTSEDPVLSPDHLTGKEFNTLLTKLPETHKAATEAHQKAVQAQEAADKAATVASPIGMSEARKAELVKEAQTAYTQAHTVLTPHLEALSEITDEGGEPLVFPAALHPEAEPQVRSREIDILRNNVLPGLPATGAEDQVKAVTGLVSAADVLTKVQEAATVEPAQAPSPADDLLRMTVGRGVLMASTPSSIPAKIAEEEAMRASSVINGVGMYSSTPQLNAIKSSIESRIAQTRALAGLTPQIELLRQTRGLPALPQADPEVLAGTYETLNGLLGKVNNLLKESQANSESADMKVAQAVSTLLRNSASYLDALSAASIGTAFKGIQPIVAASRLQLNRLLEAADVVGALRLMNATESTIYNDFHASREDILKVLSAVPYSETAVRTYDYSRGILSLSSADFWNAFHSVLSNSDASVFSPSDEHFVIVKQAVQGLMADEYSPPTIAHPNQILHHNSVFIEGRGGTAKTKTIIPLIAGVVSQLSGGKVYLTAAADVAEYKRTNLRNAVETFFKVSDSQLGISLVDSSQDILKFLQAPGATTDVNLVVYDEGTLLTTRQLAAIQTQLDTLNSQRRESGSPLLKVLYTGDTLQNSVGVNKADPDARALGIDDIHRHVIQSTPALVFSFRQSNQQLTLLSSYLEGIQREKGVSAPFATEYRSREGAEIKQGYEEFVSSATSYISSLVKQSRLHEAVYITDKGDFEVDQRIHDSKILRMTSEEAQGREWPIVFFDPKNNRLFVPGHTNLGVKKDYYTASTRTSSYLLTHVLPGQGITSSEGTVSKIRPLLPEKATRAATIERVSQIIGDYAAPVSKVAFDYTPGNIIEQGGEFPMGEEPPVGAEPPLPYQSEPGDTSAPPPDGSSIINYLKSINRKNLVSLHTFFTDELRGFDDQMVLKRKAIYEASHNPNLRKTIPYFLSINRIGSPGYENVLRNNPEFNGSYAIFIEASPNGKHVVLGVLSTPGLDEAIKEGNLLQGKEAIRFPLSGDFLSEIENTGTTLKKTDKKAVKSLGELKKQSKGVFFGTPYIVTSPSAETNIEGEPKSRRGEVFVPTSFVHDSQAIDAVLKVNNTSPYISKTPVRKRIVSFSAIVSELERFMEDGKFSMLASDRLAGRMYDAFWTHNAESGDFATGKPRENRLSEAFKAIQKGVSPTDPFYDFLGKYIEQPVTQGVDEIIEGIKGALNVTTTTSNDNAHYFLKHYLEAKDRGETKKLVNFERAVSALATRPYFRQGFEFNPRLLWKGTMKGVNAHAKAQNLPEDVYNRYLQIAGVDYVSPPSIQLPLNRLLEALRESIPQNVKVEKKPAFEGSRQAEQGLPEVDQAAASMEADARAMEDRLAEGQAKIDTEPTSSLSTTAGAATEDNPASDNAAPQVAYEDDRQDGDSRDQTTLGEFQKRWFDKPGYSPLFVETIRTFRRRFIDVVFATNAEDDAQPFLRDINTVVTNLKTKAKEMSGTFTDEYLSRLDPVNDGKERDVFMRAIMYRELPFLLKKYFPAVWQDTESKKYMYRSTHYKSRSFSEKESFNLLAEGTTDMVKTMLYNTPILRRVSEGVFEATDDYVWQGDIESLVDAAQGSTSTEEVAFHLRDNPNQAAQSVYYRYLHDKPYTLDGILTWPIGKIPNVEVFKMRDSIAQFILSGEIYDLTKVDIDEERLRAAYGPYGSPHIVRNVAHESVVQKAAQVAENKSVTSIEEGAMIVGSMMVHPSQVSPPSNDDVLAAVHAIGLTTFSLKNLQDIQKLDYASFNIAPARDVPQKVNNKIVDEIILPTLRKMESGKHLSFRSLAQLYDAMVRGSGVSGILMQLNVERNKSYRFRWGSPVFRLNTQIAETRDEDGSVHVDNLLARRDPLYKVEKTLIKDGFSSWQKSKTAPKMSAKETADFDVIWSFAHMLKEGSEGGKEDRVAMFTPMVWADSPTDPQMVVTSKYSLFRDPQSILKDLFESRKSFYQAHSAKILTAWNEFLGTRHRAESLQGLSSYLSANPIGVSEVERHPGMVPNLYYTAVAGNASIKPSMVSDVAYYSGNNLGDFITKSMAHFNALLEFSNNSENQAGESMTQRLGKVMEGRSGESLLKAFYYNWLAFSGEYSNLTAGATQQYKGDTKTKEYIDNTKRNKLQMAPRSSQLFRNKSWNNLWHQAKTASEPLSEELKYEGKKLPLHARVAYVSDIKVPLTLPGTGLQKNQEVYDGATFVFPTTRIMQKHSNSGNHGIYVGAKMKNVTTVFDNSRGVTTGVKNAEFLVTPQLMRVGTPRLLNMVRRAYSHPFTTPIQGQGVVLQTPWDVLRSLGLNEDLSNAEDRQFEDLLDILVENGQQDSLITEVIPTSARKMGGDAINDLDVTTPFVVGAQVDQVNKGTQLDSSHGIDDIKGISASQIINAMATSWPNHPLLMRMYRGLAEIAKSKVTDFRTMSKAKRVTYLKAIATKTFGKRPDMSYASLVTADPATFSIDDRQLTSGIIQNLTAELSDDAVLLDFAGGQYVVHPTNGLVQVYDVVRDGKAIVVLKDELLPAENGTAGRDLKWNRKDGYAEILLPASWRKKFGITTDIRLSDVTPEYFLANMKGEKSPRKAKEMYDNFQIMRRQLVTRIPATGKHSAVVAEVVGFVNGSENAIFVPAELLFVQGADQDDDKGTNFSYGTVFDELTREEQNAALKGKEPSDYLWKVPEVDGVFELVDKEAYPDRLRKKARTAGIKNAIVNAMERILLSPETLAERNSPVDVAKEELTKVAEKVESSYKFERDSYLSHLQMREINQAGMALRGIFSNAMKAYNVMTIAYRAAGVDPSTAGLSTDSRVSERLGALVNAAVDNAKDQLMGKLGIGEHNANMIAYLVVTPNADGKARTFQEIHDIITKYSTQMEEMKTFRRYDSTLKFRADVQWEKFPALASLEYLGNELSALARFSINRAIPSSDVDMLAYKKDVEAFINRQYDTFNLSPDFRLVAFLESEDTAQQQITKYETLKGRDKNGITRSQFNILRILHDAPHIAAYMDVFHLAHKMALESKAYTVNSRLADELMKPTVTLDDRRIKVLSDIKEFTYGLFIDSYLQNAENPTKYDLASPLGRQQFVQGVNSQDYTDALKAKYPTNSFIQELTLVTDRKRNWSDSSLLRLPDIQLMGEERRMQMMADFGKLKKDTRQIMVLYNLVTRHTKFGKDSFGTLLSPGDKADFNRFLDRRLDISNYDYPTLVQTFNDFRSGKMEGIHNAIPYSAASATKAVEKPVQLAKESKQSRQPKQPRTVTISQMDVDFLNERLEGGNPYTTNTPVDVLLGGIGILLNDDAVNPMEAAYLRSMNQRLILRQSPDVTQVDQRTKDCS